MSVTRIQLISALSTRLPPHVVERLVDEYQSIKRQYALNRFAPSELSGGRFCECMVRLLQHLNGDPVTPFGTTLPSVEGILRKAENNVSIPDGLRLFGTKLIRVLNDVRNRRDVAHVGGDVNPNLADSQLVSHCADWILTELVRSYYTCNIDTARSIVQNINELNIPLIAEVDGFVRIQNTNLSWGDKVLAILYHKKPNKVKDLDLLKWIRYDPKSSTRFKNSILGRLDSEALIHYQSGLCVLLPKGVIYVDKQIPLDLRL